MPYFPTLERAALTIAGSDSGGGAGIQADLKTFSALGVHGCSVITAITAQNSCAVTHAQPIEPAMIRAQLDAVLDDFPVTAIKTGMISSSDAIATLAESLESLDNLQLVLDPVLVATSGARLISDEALHSIRRLLLPLATLITPNKPELEALTGIPVTTSEEAIRAGQELLSGGAEAVLLKGGHWEGGNTITDILLTSDSATPMSHNRLPGEYHGTGCTLSAAITASLAKGQSLELATLNARRYLIKTMTRAEKGLKGSLGLLRFHQ